MKNRQLFLLGSIFLALSRFIQAIDIENKTDSAMEIFVEYVPWHLSDASEAECDALPSEIIVLPRSEISFQGTDNCFINNYTISDSQGNLVYEGCFDDALAGYPPPACVSIDINPSFQESPFDESLDLDDYDYRLRIQFYRHYKITVSCINLRMIMQSCSRIKRVFCLGKKQ